MLSYPDFKQKQLLFIQNDVDTKYHLRVQAENLVYLKNEKIQNRISLHKLFAVFISGHTSLTTNLIKDFQAHGISLFLLKSNFEVCAEVVARAEGNYLLRYQQYQATEETELQTARLIVANKIVNQLRLIRASLDKERYLLLKKHATAKINNCLSGQDLLAIEAEYSKIFFTQFYSEIGWLRRAPRVKHDIPNFLMDMGYTFLFNMTDALLRLHGFDTYKGVYHKLFFMRKSLACDIMEPFRCIIDKEILKAYRLGQVNSNDFDLTRPNIEIGWKERSKYAKIFSTAITSHKQDLFKYVKDYYRFVMKPDTYPFSKFIIK
jgi:CRISP-associated protein Cas1